MLEEIIGQDLLKKSINVAIVAAAHRNEVLRHILLVGQGGLGKTHTLEAIRKALGYRRVITQGNRLSTPKRLHAFLTENCPLGSTPAFVIIDEIHELTDDVQEELYYPMDHGKIVGVGEEIFLGPFCLAGATTSPDELDGKSLMNRFGYYWTLEELCAWDLMMLLHKFLEKQKLAGTLDAIRCIGFRSRGNPRLALRYIRRAIDFSSYDNRREVTLSDVEKMFSEFGVDDKGLDKIQRKYLTILYESDKPLGKEALANTLGELRPAQLTKMVEPYLWKMGYIRSTTQGRELTEAGFQHIASSSGFAGEL